MPCNQKWHGNSGIKTKLFEMRKIYALTFVLFAVLGVETNAQNVEVKIKNQRIVGNEFFFDVYLEKTGVGDLYLGYSDFVLTNILPAGAFSSPVITYTTGTNAFKNQGGTSVTTQYDASISAAIGSGANANRIIINLNQPSSFDGINLTSLNSEIAYLLGNDATQRLGTFKVTGLTKNGFYPDGEYHTTGAGIKTKIYKITPSGSFTQVRVSSPSLVTTDDASTSITAPTLAQLQAITLSKDGANSSPTSIKIDWSGVAAANGDSMIIMVREYTAPLAALSGADTTVGNALKYSIENSDWSAKANANRVGLTNYYIVYAGDQANGSVTVTNLDNTKSYYFVVIPYAGEGGYNNKFAAASDMQTAASNVTLTTTPVADEPTIHIASITLTTNQTNPNTSMNFSMDVGTAVSTDSVLIVAKNAVYVAGDRPADGNFYEDDLNFTASNNAIGGNGAKVVLRAKVGDVTGSYTVTNLTANTQYYYEVYIFRGTSGSLSQNYKISSPIAANRFTTPNALNPATAQASLPLTGIFTSVGTTGFTLNWNAGTGTGRIVVVRAENAVNATPTQGTNYSSVANAAFGTPAAEIGTANYVVYAGTGTSVTISNLAPNQRYHVAVIEYTGNTSNVGNINYVADASWPRADDNTYMNVTAKASLEGSMSTDLLSSPVLIPLSQPFNATPWSYTGTESVGSIPSGVVDWVLIELRRTTTGSLSNAGPTSRPSSGATVKARRAAFLKSDGSIVGLDGTTTDLLFEIDDEGQYFIVIYNRNHLPIMTAAANTKGTNVGLTTADLTAVANVAGSAGTDFLDVSGTAKMWAGNAVTSNYVIDAADRTKAWDDRNTSESYILSDVNLDRDVDAADRGVIWNNRDKSAYTRIVND